jgi:hypothetical protein
MFYYFYYNSDNEDLILTKEKQNLDNYQEKDTHDDNYIIDLERKLKENTFEKIIYKDEKWRKDSYKKKYEYYLLKSFNDIDKLKKIYKSNTALKELI